MCVRTRRDAEVRHYFTNYNHVPPTLMSSNPLFNKQVRTCVPYTIRHQSVCISSQQILRIFISSSSI